MKLSKTNNRGLERISLLFVSAVIVCAFFSLYDSQKPKFKDANYGIKHQSVVVLKKGFNPDELSKLLIDHNYFSDKEDVALIVDTIHRKLEQGYDLPNLGKLNLADFRIEANLVDTIGTALSLHVDKSRSILYGNVNIDSLYKTAPFPSYTAILKDGKDSIAITAKVKRVEKSASWIERIFHKKEIPVPNVIVQLKEHYWLTDVDRKGDTICVQAKDTIIAYAETNERGIAVFKGLKKDGYYSILPVKKGFEYGSSKGTSNGKSLGKSQDFTFTQKVHTIRLIDPLTYTQIKEDATVIVRTPQDYLNNLLKYIALFFLAWWSLHFYLMVRKKETDPLIIPLLMTLTGICLVVMYAIHDPLSDKILGKDMAKGVIAGVILIALLSEVNFLKFINSQSVFQYKRKYIVAPFDLPLALLKSLLKFRISGIKIYPLGVKVYQSAGKIPDGFGYLLLALLLALSLFPFGSGPEGSGVKVNLFFFQPSEIIKYLMVLFLATIFSNRRIADTLFKVREFRKIRRIILSIAGGIVVLLLIYLFLGDMGPALVLALTFIIIYSVARRDFPQLLLGIASFMLMLWLSVECFGRSPVVLAIFVLFWFVLWIAYGMANKKQIFESAIFLNLVITAFIFGGTLLKSLGMEHVGERLQGRNVIYANLWENGVNGGDQVVQGLWGLASGGLFGQGLGKGNPNLVPAFHTDMIFTSIGEELGWIGLLLIIICLSLLLHRSLLIGRRAAQPFLFYLAAGIVIVTGIQFLIITLGSIGVIPLTGVAMPFFSYGKVSLILNLVAFGIILSISKIRGSNLQKEDTIKRYDVIIGAGSIAYTVFSIVLLSVLAYYQLFARNNILVKPAFATMQNDRMIEYNPRINLLMKNLDAGIIYDRNGLILATNNADSTKTKTGKQRYYPFHNDMFFWTGDFNTKLLWDEDENARGYIAERRHLAELRGINNKAEKKDTTLLIGSRFLKAQLMPKRLVYYNYSPLIDMLKDGINREDNLVREHNEKRAERDITLTVDAALQTKLQQYIKEKAANFHRQSRVSVIVLGAENGEMLASANYPLPDQSQLKAFYENRNYKPKTIITDRDLGMTEPTAPGSTAKIMSALASFMKFGNEAENIKYYVNPVEIIHDDNGEEPNGYRVNIHDAIVKSSNVYFIKLVNDKNLYAPLASVYWETGVRVNYNLPYAFYKNRNETDKSNFQEQMDRLSVIGSTKYQSYVAEHKPAKLHDSEYQLAWGQAPVSATPLAMARVVSIVANRGVLKDTKYVMTADSSISKQRETRIVDEKSADILKGYMKAESDARKQGKNPIFFPNNVGGKSGTPQITRRANHTGDYDGWYIFFVENTKMQGTIAVVVRIENVKSGTATQLAADLVKDFWPQTKDK